MLKIQGRYLSGKTSRHQDACLEVLDDNSIHLVIDSTTNHIHIEPSDVNVTSRLGNTPREISLGEGQLLITDDNDSSDNLAKLLTGKQASFLHKLETNLPVILASLVFTAFFVAGTIVYGIPRAAEFIAHELPEFTLDKFDDGLVILDKTMFEPSQLELEKEQEIRQFFQPYLDEHAHLAPSLHFRSGVGPNAFALPGGEIVFTDEFISLTDNEHELIAVLLHELGHLHHKHMARRAIQDAMITLIVLFIVGDIGAADLVAGLPTLLLDLSYSREFEIEADKYAIERLHQAGISIESFASAMRKLYESTKSDDSEESDFEIPVYLSTHPGMEERIQLVNDFQNGN